MLRMKSMKNSETRKRKRKRKYEGVLQGRHHVEVEY
jgi:hypothetical protein